MHEKQRQNTPVERTHTLIHRHGHTHKRAAQINTGRQHRAVCADGWLWLETRRADGEQAQISPAPATAATSSRAARNTTATWTA